MATGYWRFRVVSWDRRLIELPEDPCEIAVATALCLNERYIDIFECIRASRQNENSLRATLSRRFGLESEVWISLNDSKPTPAGTSVLVAVFGTVPEISQDDLDEGVLLGLCDVSSPDGL